MVVGGRVEIEFGWEEEWLVSFDGVGDDVAVDEVGIDGEIVWSEVDGVAGEGHPLWLWPYCIGC